MSDPYLGEIRMFAGNFAPYGWALCNGQIMAISQNTALFSLLGTYYGGNGTSTFALPDLRSRVPLGQGQGPGLSDWVIGEMDGVESVTLTYGEDGPHSHPLSGRSAQATTNVPAANQFGEPHGSGRNTSDAYAPSGTPTQSATATDAFPGGNQPHENRPPTLAVSFIIALQGVYPARN